MARKQNKSPKEPKKQPKKAPAAPATKTQGASRAREGMTGLDAAAKVLSESDAPMSCPEMIETMAKKGYWKSTNGKTPAATLSSAIGREIKLKGGEARFKKVGRGKFALVTGA